MNRTTPLFEAFTSSASVVLVPSWVWTSPPKLVSATVSPALGVVAPVAGTTASAEASPLAFADKLLTASTFSLTTSFTLSTLDLGAAFFCVLAGRTGAGGGVLRLRSSTMVMLRV